MKCKSCKRQIDDDSIFCKWCGTKQLKERGEIRVPRPRKLASGAYFAQIMVGGQRVSVTADTEKEYYAQARAVKSGLVETKKAPPSLKLDDAITKYIDSRRGTVSPSTIATYEKKQRLYFRDLAEKNIYTFTHKEIQIEIAKMLTSGGAKGKPLSAKTVKDEALFILTVLDFHGHHIDVSKLSLPQVQASPFAVLTPDEIAVLLKAVKGNPCELQILLAVWLGLRRSEIIALEKSDFDFEHSAVAVNKAVVRDAKGNWVSKGTKTEKSARVIDCPEYIISLVRDMPDGKLYNYDSNYILKCLHRICEENDLPPIRLHDLRHISASINLMLGIPDKYVMERHGWASKDTMVNRYEHTYSSEKSAADRTVNAYFESLLSPKTEAQGG